MFRGFYTAASGMLTNQATLNTIANNIGNARTAGYKKDTQITPTFGEALLNRIEKRNSAPGIGQWVPIRYPQSIVTDYEMGPIEVTETPTDFVLKGPGFFTVQGPAPAGGGEAEIFLTRNGQMTVDTEGYLVVNGQYRVLSSGGEPLQPMVSDVTLSGNMLYAGEEEIGEFLMTFPADMAALTKATGDSLFTYNGEGTNEVPEGAELAIMQGAFEQSNVDAGAEMMLSMETQRAFAACSQVIKMIDAINARSVNDLARLN